MPPAEPLLLCALSGRAMAQSARAAGFAPCVLDRFGDLDTRAAAAAVAVVPPGRRRPFARAPLLRAAAALAPAPVPLSWGGGLDGAPDLLAMLARGRELLGNRPETVRRITDPFAFAATCRRLGVPVPEVARELPERRDGWLVKRRGGSGGGHVRDARDVPALAPGDYAQRRLAGAAVSVLLLGDGRCCLPLLASEQWAEGVPPRFTGVLAPARCTDRLVARLAEAAGAVGRAFALVGLASADFLVDGEAFHLLEVNPRPGASLEAAEAALGTPLMGLHVAACRGRLPAAPPRPRPGSFATAIVWAPHDLMVPEAFAWPDWAGDRTPPGTRVRAGQPLATVRAASVAGATVRGVLAERGRRLVAAMAPCPTTA
jgi:predicted ATP-grasp superfamily ATP-dependent carboligase